jgi:hypothetical protein
MDLTNYLRKDYATPSIYYGYSSNPNAASTDFSWSIRKVTSSGNTETVTWTNGDPSRELAKWNDRVNSFATPAGSLGLTCSVTDNNSVLNISWNQLSGANRYQVVVSKSGKVYSDSGAEIYYNSNFNTTQITKELVNVSTYKYKHAESSNTYSITVTAVNVTGSSASTITVTT